MKMSFVISMIVSFIIYILGRISFDQIKNDTLKFASAYVLGAFAVLVSFIINFSI